MLKDDTTIRRVEMICLKYAPKRKLSIMKAVTRPTKI